MKKTNSAIKFTVDYVMAIKARLKIEINEIGAPVYVPERVEKSELYKLRDDLSDIWSSEEDARISVKNVEDAFLQSVAYGLVDDFDLFLKSGYLIGDRIILWDYIYGRLLRKKNIDNVDYLRLGVIANNLISTIEFVSGIGKGTKTGIGGSFVNQGRA